MPLELTSERNLPSSPELSTYRSSPCVSVRTATTSSPARNNIEPASPGSTDSWPANAGPPDVSTCITTPVRVRPGQTGRMKKTAPPRPLLLDRKLPVYYCTGTPLQEGLWTLVEIWS